MSPFSLIDTSCLRNRFRSFVRPRAAQTASPAVPDQHKPLDEPVEAASSLSVALGITLSFVLVSAGVMEAFHILFD